MEPVESKDKEDETSRMVFVIQMSHVIGCLDCYVEDDKVVEINKA
jgi:hypothetical protein